MTELRKFGLGMAALLLVAGAAIADDQHQSGSNYSGLARINAGNVANLELAWKYKTGEAPKGKILNKLIAFEDQPNLIDGNLVVCTTSWRLIALDPQTGKERWVFDPKEPLVGTQKCRGISHWVDRQAPADKVAAREFSSALPAIVYSQSMQRPASPVRSSGRKGRCRWRRATGRCLLARWWRPRSLRWSTM